MGIKAQNGYMAFMAKQLVAAISNCGNPFIEEYLDSMDCSVEAEVSNLGVLQQCIARNPGGDHSRASDVLNKWLYGWKAADKCLACMGLKPSAAWAEGYYKAGRA
ncbi:hypothetical protein [Pseudomonas aeruginosa]|uniref:hypothetical protein n=1 Tax=Pseudomonas aeruginosa TaxID=287 RepID=UPI000EB5DD62|nr:hypothetical protein [Pseudomonas aeruginosa]